MARGIEINGQLRGKRGGVVYTRMDGQQVSRARNFAPKNPRTNKQLYQRAIMATVAQAYAAGKDIFDHSFQDIEAGEKSQRHFLKLNAKLLRSLLSEDIAENHQDTNLQVALTAPGLSQVIPNTYIISEGTLKQDLIQGVNGTMNLHGLTTASLVKDWIPLAGLVKDDIYTFCEISFDMSATPVYSLDNEISYASIMPSVFVYVQLKVKDLSSISDSLTIGNAKKEDIFEIKTSPNATYQANIPLGNIIASGIRVNGQRLGLGAAATIRSREDSPLRSTAIMDIDSISWGLTHQYVLEAWQNASKSLGDSELILEGSNF